MKEIIFLFFGYFRGISILEVLELLRNVGARERKALRSTSDKRRKVKRRAE